MLNNIKSIDVFIAEYLKDASDYCKTEARILNSFLIALDSRDFTIDFVHDGEDVHYIKDNSRFEALYHIFSVDTSILGVSTADNETINLHLLIGEGESQTIYDHTASKDSDDTENMIFSLWAGAVRTHDAALYRDYWA